MSYIEKYKARMAKQGDGSNRSLRNKQAKDTYNRHFKDTIGYREATVWDRESVEKGWINEVSLDVIVETNTNGYEKMVSCRPDTKLIVGSYISFKEFENDSEPKTYIVRELVKPDPIPTYRVFECSQKLCVEGCPIEFPCFSYNSTYSSKGLIDTDRNYMLDSRNKLYVQKNKYSCRLWEHYHGYRIRMGDEDGWVTFKITEMDDFSYKGMFIVSLKVEQRHHLDGATEPQFAYNETKIDFTDLKYEFEDEDGTITESIVQPILVYDKYVKVGKTIDIASSKPITTWEYDNTFFEEIQEESEDTFKATPIKEGMLTITATDSDNQIVVANIIVKES